MKINDLILIEEEPTNTKKLKHCGPLWDTFDIRRFRDQIAQYNTSALRHMKCNTTLH